MKRKTITAVAALLVLLAGVTAAVALDALDPTTTWDVTPQPLAYTNENRPEGDGCFRDQFQSLTEGIEEGTASATYEINGREVTLNLTIHPDNSFDFEVLGGLMTEMFVKGGAGGQYLLYQYEPPVAGATNTGPVSSDTGLHDGVQSEDSEVYQDVSHLEFCMIPKGQPLTAQKTAETSYTRKYTWEIDKEYDGEYWKFIGDPATTHDYAVSVDQTIDEYDFAVDGTITIYNSNPFSVPVSVADSVGGTSATVDCGGGTATGTVPAASNGIDGQLECSYTADLATKTNGINVATITSSDPDVDGTTAEAAYVFGDPTTVIGSSSVNVSDTNGESWTTSGDATWTYSKDFECSTNPDDYTDGFYTFSDTNTASIDGTDLSDDATVTVNCYAPVPSKDAETSYTRKYTWEIDKEYDGEYWKFIGDPATTHGYEVSVDQTIDEYGFAVDGTITVQNYNPEAAMTVSLEDYVGSTLATLDCDGTLMVPTATDAGPGEATCGYTADLGAKTDGTNTATVTLNEIDFEATADYAFGDPTTVIGDSSISVTDTNGESWTASEDDSWTYTRDFTCPTDTSLYENGVYSEVYTNTATIDETGQSDDATVTLNCYAPLVEKDADTEWVEEYTWSITKSVGPESHSGAPGDVFTSTYTVSVDQTVTPSGFRAFGTISVTNPNPSVAMTVDVEDAINGTSATVNCGEGTAQLTVEPGQTGTCSYSVDLPDATSRTNTATATLNGIGFTATANVVFGDPTVVGYPEIDVTDYFDGDLEGDPLGSASGDLTFDLYNRSFECPTDESLYADGVYTASFPNFAEIDQTGQEDDANVDLICTLDPGRIIVEKVTVPSGADQRFTFNPSWGASFDLGDGESEDSGPLTPGTYSVSETVPEGWELTSAVCSDESEPSDIDLGSGETVTCTFTNTGLPSYTFQKYINGEDADTLNEAVDVEEGDTLTFTYMLTNTGNIAITWTDLDDDVFGSLTDECSLPVEIGVGESASCDILREAGDFEQGKQNIGTAYVEGLDPQTDPAWYRTPAPTPVTLLYFRAQGTDSAIQVEWGTAAEINMAGYYVYRGASDEFDAAEPIAFRVAKGSDSTYEVLDKDVEADKTYWYWLASVENDGSQELEGPVKASFTSN